MKKKTHKEINRLRRKAIKAYAKKKLRKARKIERKRLEYSAKNV